MAFDPTSASMYTCRIPVYVLVWTLVQVISVLGIDLICWTKINAAGQAIAPQLGFNQPRWIWTDLRSNHNRNRNGACQIQILGAELYRGKSSERKLIAFRWTGFGPSEDVNGYFVFCVYFFANVSICAVFIEGVSTKTMTWIYNWSQIETPKT